MIVTTEAIVLAARRHGETSKIVWLYTRDFGKVSVIAKGARELKSKFGGALEMFAKTSATFYKKEREAGLYLLSKADLIDSNRGILSSLSSLESATEIIEILIRTMHDEEKNEAIFELLSSTLGEMALAPSAASTYYIRFAINFTRISGFEIHAELPEAIADGGTFRFHYASGELVQYPTHDEYLPGTMALSNGAAMTLARIATPGESVASIRMTDGVADELRTLFRGYFAHHFSGFSSRSLKSIGIFASMKRSL